MSNLLFMSTSLDDDYETPDDDMGLSYVAKNRPTDQSKRVYATSAGDSGDGSGDDFKLGSRARLEDYLEDSEINRFRNDENLALRFKSGELESMKKIRDDDESSFNDDGIPLSEEEYFSSDYIESDVGDYVPPLTTTKKALIYRLVQYQISESDDDEKAEVKQTLRQSALSDFWKFLLKKRAAKAYLRFMRAREVGKDDIHQEAFFLEKMEFLDKKLLRPFYYEEYEPWTYKKLLHKRRRAIKRKYERYALDPDYRNEFKLKVLKNVGKYLITPGNRTGDETHLSSTYHTAYGGSSTRRDELSFREETSYMAAGPSRLVKKSYTNDGPDTSEEDEEYEDAQSVSEGSSFYDDVVPQSELDFFSSEYEEDCEVYYPGPKSRTLDRYRRYLAKCQSQFFDDEKQRADKKIRAADIEAQFQNYLEKKRALKALARVKIVEEMKLKKPVAEAEQYLHLEILDKKLHRPYYYGRDEPDTYKTLLGKRRRAIIRKYERFAADERYRNQMVRNIYADVLRIRRSPVFDAEDSEIDEESSFVDTEVPTSEERFMSAGEIVLPRAYEKPLTRRKQDLYAELEQYEPDGLFDTDEVIQEKRKRRLEIIQRFQDSLANRRAHKAFARYQDVKNMGVADPYLMAHALRERELADKKLNRGFYYSPAEPNVFKHLLEKRLRAIDRKCHRYAKDRNYREQVNAKMLSGKPRKKQEPEYDREVTWQLAEASSIWNASWGANVSNIEKGKAKERRREQAKAGVWPPHRESAPPIMGMAGKSFDSEYGSWFDRDYYKDLLVNQSRGRR